MQVEKSSGLRTNQSPSWKSPERQPKSQAKTLGNDHFAGTKNRRKSKIDQKARGNLEKINGFSYWVAKKSIVVKNPIRKIIE